MRELTVVHVFVSSPGDCDAERAAIEARVASENLLWRTARQIEVRTFGPENLYPGVGQYGQEVVNRQLTEYDIYVGIWRERKGTPTPVAPSGTVEELRNAFARRALTRRPWILPYFWSDSPTDFSEVKNAIVEQGGFYQHFQSPANLAEKVREHLDGVFAGEFRRTGHSTTHVSRRTNDGRVATPTFVFQVVAPDGSQRSQNVERAAVAIGRMPERNQIVVTSDRVHREQGLFVWEEGQTFYIDIGGDSRIEQRRDRGSAATGNAFLGPGDAVVLPDGSRIILRGIVPPWSG